jgi:eukaryotic-like serine/threonine-protein kinase
MTLTAGTRLGRYEIRSKLGEGGMGEVYRARDEKLNRDVAIKVLPATLSQDGDRLRRFEQEAQAAGALNHPNILAVHDVGTHDGSPYIVSELLEGEELREQLNDGSIPQRKALDYAQQIAQGLAAAHERGITHRDLKPENLFITTDGRVKILDFGLAKLRPLRNESVSSEIDTRRQITDPGTVMGTVGYMSPEQVRGHEADHRSDIFSFGSILYEMLAGQRAFRRDTMAETMTAILKEDPPELSETNAKISLPLEKIVRRCLEKKPERRFHSAHDLAFAIESLSGTATSSGQTMTMATLPSLRPRTRERMVWIASTFVLLIALALASLYFRRTPIENPTAAMRFTISLPEKLRARPGSPEISPDGRNLVFSAFREDNLDVLWLRSLSSLAAQQLPGTESTVPGAYFWSPDSRSIGFFSDGKLKKIDLAGGPPQTLCNVPPRIGGGPPVNSGTWNRDGIILLSADGVIYRISAAGGEPVLVLGKNQENREAVYGWPSFLPDGRHFLSLRIPAGQGAREIYLASLDGKESTRLLAADSHALYAVSATGSGYLLFARAGALLAQPFEASSLKLMGEPFVVANTLRVNDSGRGHYSVSENGILVYDPTNTYGNEQLIWLDRAGKRLESIGAPGIIQHPTLSPDGKQVAVDRRDLQTGNEDIYVIDLARGTSSRLTFDPASDRFPVWSPDGTRIAWSSDREGSFQIYQKLASGVGPEELLLKSEIPSLPTSWSADGKFILYTGVDPKTSLDLWVLPLVGDRKPFPFLQTPFNEYGAAFSPDGRWIAYQSNDQGVYEVYVQTFPASGNKWKVSTDTGAFPIWRRDGRELFYIKFGALMSAEVKPGSSFEAGVPKVLFDLAGRTRGAPVFAATADGQRFLLVSQVEDPTNSQFTVVVNWSADLKK